MKRVEMLVWGGLLLTAATLGVLAWRPPAPAGFDAGSPLWWQPEPLERPGTELNLFTLGAAGGGDRLLPIARGPDLDESAIGLRFALPTSGGGVGGISPPPMLPPRADDESSDRTWSPDADASSILGARGGGRRQGWLERDVSARQDAAAFDRQPADAVGYESLLRPGMGPTDGGLRILQYESVFGE